MNLDGKIALVTGGSRGIGRAICIALANAGASVVLTYRQQADAAQSVVNAILEDGGIGCAVQMDVRDRQSIKSAVNFCETEMGGLDVLVNNAGINKPTDFDKVTEEDWDNILAVNLKGPFLCSQEALALLRLRGGGSIINIGSVSGQYGGPRTAHYAASKAALISLGQVVARFVAPDGIRCNTIAAGLIGSEMAASGLQSPVVKQAADTIPLGRLGTPEEVASMAVYLASDEAVYITAQTINVNGGLYF